MCGVFNQLIYVFKVLGFFCPSASFNYSFPTAAILFLFCLFSVSFVCVFALVLCCTRICVLCWLYMAASVV